MPLTDLLEQVRIHGRVKIDRTLPLEKNLPIIIREDGGDIPYLNSGGRSIIFNYNGSSYRLKGVDPYGILTKRVATSSQNKLIDIELHHQLYSGIASTMPELITHRNKPFGTISKEDAMREKLAFEILSEKYRRLGIAPPAEYVATRELSSGNVQNLYKLPSLSSDFRLEEFDQLMRERLNRCDAKELESKANKIFKLYARILLWEGWNFGLLARNKLKPTSNSWMPQNFVISECGNGYGVFRVDHTSTELKGENDCNKLLEEMLSEAGLTRIGDVRFGSYAHIPMSIPIAINYEFTTNTKPNDKEPLFDQGYLFMGEVKSWERGYGYFLEVLGKAFVGGYLVVGDNRPEPIQETMFREALA